MNVLETIGDTPLVRLQHLAPAGGAETLVKLEYRNPTGSMKDRTHWDPANVDEVWTIEDGEAIEMTRRLAAEEGIFAGISSGANVVGARRLAEQLGPGTLVVTLAVDSGFKYMSGEPYA